MNRKIELGYLAGMLDGEGTISILSIGSPPSHTVRVSMGNTDRAALDRIAQEWGGKVTLWDDKREQRGWKTMFFWYITGMKAIELLEIVGPHLTIKAPQCAVALQMKELHGTRGKKPAPGIIERRQQLKESINELNKRGVQD